MKKLKKSFMSQVFALIFYFLLFDSSIINKLPNFLILFDFCFSIGIFLFLFVWWKNQFSKNETQFTTLTKKLQSYTTTLFIIFLSILLIIYCNIFLLKEILTEASVSDLYQFPLFFLVIFVMANMIFIAQIMIPPLILPKVNFVSANRLIYLLIIGILINGILLYLFITTPFWIYFTILEAIFALSLLALGETKFFKSEE
jgi:magnesium-transporting ATPase (P-type)